MSSLISSKEGTRIMKVKHRLFPCILSLIGLGLFSLPLGQTNAEAKMNEGKSVLTNERTTADEIVLERRVIFQGVDGNPAPVEPSSYWVESAGKDALRLVPSIGEAITIVAQATTHEENLSINIALAEHWEEDEFHIALMMPGGDGLDAHGSLSGVQSRAARRTLRKRTYTSRVRSNLQQKAQRISAPTRRKIQAPLSTEKAAINCLPTGLGYPQVTAVSPSKRGMMNQEIVFSGLNLNTKCFKVRLGAKNLTLTSRTPSAIRAKLPNQLMVGNLVVSHGTTSTEFVYKANYEVSGPPIITNVSPLNFARGEKVTIHGTDLDQIGPFAFSANRHFVQLKNDSPYQQLLETIGWTVSAERKTVTFNVREFWHVNLQNPSHTHRLNPQPDSRTGQLFVTQGGSGSKIMAGSAPISWQYDPGLQVTKVRSRRWNANFIIVEENTLKNAVDVTGRGLYGDTTISIGDLPISQKGLDYRGQAGWVRLPYSTQTGPMTFQRGSLTTTWPLFRILHGPQFVPGTFDQFGTSNQLEIQIGTTYTLQGWELAPKGVRGLRYEFALSGLAQSSCPVALNVLQHTQSNLSFKVEATGEIPTSCDSSTLFGDGDASNVLLLTAKYGKTKTMELLRKPYFLKR